MPEIEIAGATILIDKIDLPIISGRGVWLAGLGYPQIRQGHSHAYLHRLVLGAKQGECVDHINGNKLDNRRANLRLCNNRENGRNRSGPAKSNLSGYRGVSWNRGWFARINVEDKTIHLGRFKTKEQAAKAYDRAALQYFGAFAGKLNFPHK